MNQQVDTTHAAQARAISQCPSQCRHLEYTTDPETARVHLVCCGCGADWTMSGIVNQHHGYES